MILLITLLFVKSNTLLFVKSTSANNVTIDFVFTWFTFDIFTAKYYPSPVAVSGIRRKLVVTKLIYVGNEKYSPSIVLWKWRSVKLHTFQRKVCAMEFLLSKYTRIYDYNCTITGAITGVFLWIYSCDLLLFFFVFSFYISIRSQKLFKLDFLENSAKITGKHLCRSLETPTRCLTERFAKIFKNYFFTEYLPTTLSDFLSTLFLDVVLEQIKTCLAHSWRRSLSYRNQSVDSNRKSMDWFPYNRHSSIQ